MASLTIRIPRDLEDQIEAESKARGVSKSDLAREALTRQMRVVELRRIREELALHFETRGIFTEEDVFKRLREKL
jgi:hypothetical protein